MFFDPSSRLKLGTHSSSAIFYAKHKVGAAIITSIADINTHPTASPLFGYTRLPKGKRCVLTGSFASTGLIRMNCCTSPVFIEPMHSLGFIFLALF